MQKPSVGEVHVDALLTGFSIKYRNPAYVGLQVFPEVKVTKQSDKYATYGKEHLVNKPDERAPGDPANEIFYSVDLTNTYYCDGHALKQKVPDKLKENADSPLEPEMDATENVSDSVDLNKEIRIKTASLNTATVSNTTPTTRWDQANSTPIEDILQTAAKNVQNKSLKVPNKILIPFNVAVVLSWNSQMKEIVKYTNPSLLLQDEGIILPKKLWGMDVVVPGAGYNTANLGQTASLSPIWGTSVLVYYSAPSPSPRHVSFGYTFVWGKRTVSKWYDNPIKSTWIEVEEYADEKIICADCGYILNTVLT